LRLNLNKNNLKKKLAIVFSGIYKFNYLLTITYKYMKTSYEIKQNIQSHVESCIQDNKDSIKAAFKATKDNESITLIEYLDDLINESSHYFANDSIIYYQTQWDIVYAFKFGPDNDYYENALSNCCEFTNLEDEIARIAGCIMESLFRESLENDLNKYEQQKLMQIA
jgi:hypothetical protein